MANDNGKKWLGIGLIAAALYVVNKLGAPASQSILPAELVTLWQGIPSVFQIVIMGLAAFLIFTAIVSFYFKN